MADIYRSTARFTIEPVENMGVTFNQVTDNVSGMITAVLTDEDFAKQYELV